MSATSDILAKLATAPQYHPSSAELFADWSLQAGDQITVKSGEDSYAMPIFNLSLDWNGAASVVVENTGNENRDDLAELNETEKTAFQTARGGYSAQKEQEAKNIGYQTSIDKSLKEVGMTAAALGVQLDRDGNPVVDPNTGEFVWDDTHGATVYSRLSLVANRAQLISAINNPQGTDVISGAKIDLSAQGSVLIQAINNNSVSSIRLEADQIDIDGLVTALAAKSIGVGSLEVEGETTFKSYIYAEAAITCEETIRANTGFDPGSGNVFTEKNFTYRTYTLSNGHYYLYSNSQTGSTPDGSVNGYVVTGSTSTTIYYLGRDAS